MLEKLVCVKMLLLAIILLFLDVIAPVTTANALEQDDVVATVVDVNKQHDDDSQPTTTTSFLRSTGSQPAQESSSMSNRFAPPYAEYDVESDVLERNLQDSTVSPTPTSTTYNKTVSSYFLWESSMWSQRSLKANITLDIEAFETALLEASENNCDLGITATLFDENSQLIYQETVGSKYHALEEAGEPFVDGWTGDNTTFALYSNSKIFAAVLFMAAVVDQGRGYLDEPLYRTFEYLNETDRVGKITPRMILSHRSGIQPYNRNDPSNDPFYKCMYNGTTLLSECVEEFLLNDEALQEEPGSFVRYNNDPFVILADLILRKTGSNDLDQVLNEYITEPLGMNATTYNCPLVGSTGIKPHVSWGVCSTGTDVPKLIQALANDGISSDGRPILTADSVRQILSFQTGTAENGDTPLQFNVPLGSCIGRIDSELDNALIGYGLGTMITAGVKGQLFLHASTVGGFWVVAPGRYSAYFAWMRKGSFPSVYTWMARVIDIFERASTFLVSNTWEGNNWNEITPCIDGMFIESDLIDQYVNGASSCP